MAQTTIITNQSERLRVGDGTSGIIETIQPTSTCNEFAREVEGISIRFRHLTAPVIYRKQLKMYCRMAQWADRHETLVNTAMAAQVVAFMIYVFLFY